MKKDNKKALYESIMVSVAKEVKKTLNEYDGWTTTTTLDPTSWDDQSEPEFVDLGLSVKWAKYNLGATPGKKPEDWYGNYYAWGETEPKSSCNQGNYKFFNNSSDDYIKYNDNDHKNILMPNDDAATVNCGRPWRIPTKEEVKELIIYTINHWVTDYKGIQGLNGRVFTSKINANTLFIPASGYKHGSIISTEKNCGNLWASNLKNYTAVAYRMYFDLYEINMLGEDRWHGLSVRPVLD